MVMVSFRDEPHSLQVVLLLLPVVLLLPFMVFKRPVHNAQRRTPRNKNTAGNAPT
ncbi:hypothetical protein Acr_03g0015890 [Actinidia rufa]|uniref:Uncharacterized protein n=1 Tax=Actinidia rufa TaxID=165716 RepID=A0A7J0EEC7_9ERIC|nr:hypothetical protein Acr_03g0015890 [Actinidia rufa]